MVSFFKTLSQLPKKLKPNAFYVVRTGQGVAFYITDLTGKNAHGMNGLTTPASRMEMTENRVFFDLGDRVNAYDRATTKKTSANGAWADRLTLVYS